MKNIICLLTLALLFSCAEQEGVADRVIIGKIWTANTLDPWAEAIAIVDDTIAMVGTERQVRKWLGDSTQVTNVPTGQLVVPGFTDSHVHFGDGGLQLSTVQLRDIKSKEGFIEAIKAYAGTLTKGEWIVGGDWDHTNWGGELPDRQWIDSVTNDYPVWITRLDGHMGLANSSALAMAGIDENTEQVFGGTIVHDEQGRVTGALKDNAMGLVSRHVPTPADEQLDAALEAAMNYAAARGITSVHNMSGHIEVFERARDENKMITRIYAGMPLRNWRDLKAKIEQEGRGDKWLKIGNLKGYVDGSLGSHTAAFLAPFVDAPADSGFFITPLDSLFERTKGANAAGLQVMIHAIGDRANREVLNIFESVMEANGTQKDKSRFRIEHVQHLDAADIERISRLGVIASMQPYHLIDDGRWAEKVIGNQRSRTSYAYRSLLDVGTKLVFGSDWNVAPADVIMGIYGAVTRRTLDEQNPGGWVPEQKITIDEALRAYTIDAAYASFDENIKGSIETGKLADIVVLSEDLFSIDPNEIRNVVVVETIVGGKTVYQIADSGAEQ